MGRTKQGGDAQANGASDANGPLGSSGSAGQLGQPGTRTSQGLEKQFRLGRISASVFLATIATEDGRIERRSVNVQRAYQDDAGTWQHVSNFSLADLPAAIRCLQLAQEYVETRELSAET